MSRRNFKIPLKYRIINSFLVRKFIYIFFVRPAMEKMKRAVKKEYEELQQAIKEGDAKKIMMAQVKFNEALSKYRQQIGY